MLLLLGGGGSPSGGVSGPFSSTVIVEFSPTTAPLDTPVWVDITSKVRFQSGIRISRGRSSELDEFQTGTCQFVLDNRDRLFDPSYTAGTYYGNLKVLRRFRVTLTYAGTPYTVFSGFIRAWPQVYEVSDSDSTVPVDLFDGFGLLALASLFDVGGFTLDSATLGVLDEDRLGISGEDAPVDSLSGVRAASILAAVGWPDINAEDGMSTVTSASPTGDLVSYLRQLEKSEDGFFYFAGDGTATFLARSARQTLTRMATSQRTFDDDGTDLGYSQLELSYDLDRLYNDIRRTGTSGEEQAVEDDSSISDYFRRTQSETLLVPDDNVAADLATLFLDRYKEPTQRVPEITVPAGRDPSVLMPAILGTELLDRVTVRRTPQGVGTVNTSENLVERIDLFFNPKQLVATFGLSPAYTTSWFTLDSATYGVLDEDLLAG